MFGALALRRRSDEGLMLGKSAFESLYGGQFLLSTQFIKPDNLVILQHSVLFGDLINVSLQPQTLVLLVMAVSTSASKETITKQRAPAMLITSWRVMMKKLAEVLDNFVFNEQ